MPPIGWYLAQGLYPLGEDSSDDGEGPCELPNGRIVCGPHGLVYCPRCCSDYSFMDELDDEEDDEEVEEDKDKDKNKDKDKGVDEDDEYDPLKKRRGTGQVLPTKFDPPLSLKPTQVFCGRKQIVNFNRFIRPNDPRGVLIMTDGACLNNGQSNPKAGWAFVHGTHAGKLAIASGRLESKGPFGDESIQTSNRAELRAVIAALRFRYWPGEGFNTITIATDSEYVVEGSTTWMTNWIRRGWKTAANGDVKNKDMWEMLLGEVERLKEAGLSIQFWRIPREWNTDADAAAKEAASEDETPDGWVDQMGIAI